jgi:hypothetical protein
MVEHTILLHILRMQSRGWWMERGVTATACWAQSEWFLVSFGYSLSVEIEPSDADMLPHRTHTIFGAQTLETREGECNWALLWPLLSFILYPHRGEIF